MVECGGGYDDHHNREGRNYDIEPAQKEGNGSPQDKGDEFIKNVVPERRHMVESPFEQHMTECPEQGGTKCKGN